MHNYIAFYNGRRHELQAATLYAAKLAAIAYFNPPKSKAHMVSVVPCDVPVSTASFG